MYLTNIAEHAKQTPLLPAMSQPIDNGWLTLSWQKVWHNVKTIAAALERDGVRQGDRVAIFANNSIDWALVDLACLYVGVISVPIYATATSSQVDYMLAHSGACFVFAGTAQLEALRGSEYAQQLPPIVILNQQESLWTDGHAIPMRDWLADIPPTQSEPFAAQPNDVYTLAYTSGTTGNPKGVMLTHGNLVAAVNAHLTTLNFCKGDRSLAALPLSHVFERGWSYIVLSAGGHNHYLPDVTELQNALTVVKPHVVCVVPRILEKIHAGVFKKAKQAGKVKWAILHWANLRVVRNEKLLQQNKPLGWWRKQAQHIAQTLVGTKIKAALGGEIKFMPCGGAALDHDIHAFFMGMGINIKIGYGMTETMATISFMPDTGYKLGTLGKPLDGIDIKIDPSNQEILARSPSMTIGYYNDPAATAQLFKDGWLRTGDAGSIDEQGNLVFRERIKELMKTSGGKYIAPQHIEGILARESLFEQVAVIADARNYVSALIVPAWESLEEYAKSINIQWQDHLDLMRNAKIVAYIEQRLNEVQADLANYERVKKFTLLLEPFSEAAGHITPTLKLKRRIINEQFAPQIEAMYGK